MTIDEFWNIIERVHKTSKGDMENKCKLLRTELRRLSAETVFQFEEHFSKFEGRAYRWDLWAAAYIMYGGCSDDGFDDFRSTLISMGRSTFERAIADPESLAGINYDAESSQFEGYQYVANNVYEELTHGAEFESRYRHPKEPVGTRWEEQQLPRLFPKLCKKYGFQ